MTPTKEQQAQEYAEKKIDYPCPDYGWYESDDEQMKECLAQVWLDGYTACEQSMWRSVEEERPQKNGDYLICTEYREIEIAFWDDNYWLGNDSYPVIATHWRDLPSLPDTNTEKK